MAAGKVQVVAGGQFGSEAKGAVAAHLAKGRGRIMAVRVAGPNAGHSAVDALDRKWALRQIPVMAVVNEQAQLVIAAGSEIDPHVLEDEINMLEEGGFKIRNRLWIDAQATVIDDHHKADENGDMPNQESLIEKIGSTGKGVGAARAARVMREATLWGDGWEPRPNAWVSDVPCDTAHVMAAHLQSGRDLILEGTQGFGLGLHAGYYPYCTSSDCRAVDFLSMAGISPWARWVAEVEVWVVLRTFPIRVAGNSGPLLAETSWEDLGHATHGYIQPEYTTVTKKMRRVGAWDPDLANRAVQHNGGSRVKVALSFFDYWFNDLAGETDRSALTAEHYERIAEVEHNVGAQVCLVGTGPGTYIDL